jgi:hypothetical protein
LAREVGEDRTAAYVLEVLGRVFLLQGQVALARSSFQQSLRIRRELGFPQGIAAGLESWARLAAAERDPEGAVRLIGAAEALRKKITMPLPPIEQPEQTQVLEAARASLGEQGFAAAWEAGRAMTWEQAVASALQEEPAQP